MAKGQSLQDPFLNALRKERIPVRNPSTMVWVVRRVSVWVERVVAPWLLVTGNQRVVALEAGSWAAWQPVWR